MLGILIEKAWCAGRVAENPKEGTPKVAKVRGGSGSLY